jgi:glucose-1-phosphatase
MPAMKTVFFDIGNVLIFFSHEKMCEQIAEVCQITQQEVRELFFSKKFFINDFEKGQISLKELLSPLIAEEKMSNIDENLLKRAISDIFTPNESIFPLIDALKNQGCQLIIISNTCEPHFEFISSKYSVFKRFDHQVLSYKENLSKPDPKIFEKALKIANTDPINCFFVDDIEENVESAKKCHIHSHLYQNVASLKKELIDKRFLGK